MRNLPEVLLSFSFCLDLLSFDLNFLLWEMESRLSYKMKEKIVNNKLYNTAKHIY